MIVFNTLSLSEAALTYARGGWPVFPVYEALDGRCGCENANCDSPGKHPRTPHGLRDATLDCEQIREWWARWPNANIGVRTGAESGLVVVDLDQNPNQLDSALAAQGITRGATPNSRTGGGGRHDFYAHPREKVPTRVAVFTLPSANGAKPPQVDIRGENGYVVMPPSLHISGRRYAWERDPFTTELAPFPPAWLDLLNRSRTQGAPWGLPPSESGGAWFDEAWAGVPEGRRNETAARLAGYWLHVTKGNEEASYRAMEAWAQRCIPPMKLRELQATVQSVARRESAKSTAPFPPAGPFARTLSAFLAVADDPVHYLVERLIVAEANGWLGGEPKSLKSWLALYLGLCIARGVLAFGQYPVPAPARVLYVQEEDGERRVRRRIRKILLGLGAEAPSDAYFRLSIKAGVLLDEPPWLDALRAELDAFRPALVICDVFELMHSKDSDKRTELKPVLYRLDRLREEFNCGFLLVDHFKKASIGSSKRGGQRLSGSVGKHAWGESSIYLYPTGVENQVRVETELKDGPSEQFNLTLADTEDGGVQFLWEAARDDRAAEMKAKILETLAGVAAGKWVPTKAVAEAAGVASNTASKWLNVLADEDHKVERERRPVGKTTRSEWRLRA